MGKEEKNDERSRTWFCVFDNPRQHDDELKGLDNDMLVKVFGDRWVHDNPTRTCAVRLCVSEKGLEHIHAVLCDSVAQRFSALKSLYPSMHISPTRGTKKQAEDYINKVGSFAEKGEKILCSYDVGEIIGHQGKRTDLDTIQELIESGLSPSEIFRQDIKFRKWEKIIKEAYYQRCIDNTPLMRDVFVEWHYGSTGTGKSYTYIDLCKDFGRDNVYIVSDYDNGFFDLYSGEKVLFLDEFRGQIPYHILLSICDVYLRQFHARYTNVFGVWNKVVICSPFPPDCIYKNLSQADSIKQLLRRINVIYHHTKDDNGYHIEDVTNGLFTSCSVNPF